jgi:hypothetical protein
MCTLVILHRPEHDWPVLIAANRDEMLDRSWAAPARHWPDRPEVVAGRDHLAGGSWLGINDHGLCAGILNRVGSLGPSDGKRTRGELVLDALDHADAADAAEALAALDGGAYRPFNLVLADNSGAYWLRHDGSAALRLETVPPGLSMFTAHDRNSPESPRVRQHLPRFAAASPPDPETGDWREWEKLLASKGKNGEDASEQTAMCVSTPPGFGTVNASLIALPAAARSAKRPVWRFAGGPPDEFSFSGIEV